jgi:hypothetical protein
VKHLNQVRDNTLKHFPMAIFDCEREMLGALQQEARAKRIKWEVITRADSAGPGTRDWENLVKLASAGARRVEERPKARERSTLVIPGLLGRYGQLSVLERLADSLGPQSLCGLLPEATARPRPHGGRPRDSGAADPVGLDSREVCSGPCAEPTPPWPCPVAISKAASRTTGT